MSDVPENSEAFLAPDISPVERRELRREWFIRQAAKRPWQLARSKDHEYLVRHRTCPNEVYEIMARITLVDGTPGSFYGASRMYYVPGDGYRYWLMTFDISESIILNRCEDDGIWIHK